MEHEEAWRERWLAERNEALVHVARSLSGQTIAAWRAIEDAIDGEIIRRRSGLSHSVDVCDFANWFATRMFSPGMPEVFKEAYRQEVLRAFP